MEALCTLIDRLSFNPAYPIDFGGIPKALPINLTASNVSLLIFIKLKRV